MTINGCEIDLPSLTPRRALDHRIALLPGDRQGASGIATLDIIDNLFLPGVGRFFRTGWLHRQEMHQTAARIMAEYDARPAVPTMRLGALSGGNAQKLLLGKWLRLGPQLLLLVQWLSNSSTISGISPWLVHVVTTWQAFGVSFAFFYGLIAAFTLWYLLEYTPIGRRLLFVGRGREVARLNGINVGLVRAAALVASSILATIAV